MKKLLCRLFGHKLTLDVAQANGRVIRLRCIRCNLADPYRHN